MKAHKNDDKQLFNYLVERYGILLDTKALSEIFNLKVASLRNSINEARFPIPTSIASGKRLADIRDVVDYINTQRNDAHKKAGH